MNEPTNKRILSLITPNKKSFLKVSVLMSLILGGEMLGRTKSGICGKKQIKPTKRERKRDPKVVSFRR